jgi:hypothetical protein
VYDVKSDENGVVDRFKARLVAQGFSQKEGIDYNETFAPTMHIKTARVLLALAASQKLEVRQYDVSTAFLHASLLETVYVKQPPGHIVKGKETYVYRLKKAMYGLKNAPKAYSDHFMGVLSDLGFVQSQKDECLWTLRRDKKFVHYLFHVDDILAVSNSDALRQTMFAALKRLLKIRDEGEIKKFLGMEINRLPDGSFTLNQKLYIEKMAEKFNVNDDTKTATAPYLSGVKLFAPTENEIEQAKHLPYPALIGNLIYAAKTRFEISFALSDCARFMSNWSEKHFKAAMRILIYLYQTRDRLLHIQSSNDLKLTVYCDANHGDDRENENNNDSDDSDKWKSQGGFLVFIGNSLVSWRSRRHKSRSLSSMESEYIEASEAAKEIVWFRALMKDLDMHDDKPAVMYEDNKSCIAFCSNNTAHDRTKHIDIRAYWMRDIVKSGVCVMQHVETQHQLADMMTKYIAIKTFIKHVNKIYDGCCIPPVARTINMSISHCGCLGCCMFNN